MDSLKHHSKAFSDSGLWCFAKPALRAMEKRLWCPYGPAVPSARGFILQQAPAPVGAVPGVVRSALMRPTAASPVGSPPAHYIVTKVQPLLPRQSPQGRFFPVHQPSQRSPVIAQPARRVSQFPASMLASPKRDPPVTINGRMAEDLPVGPPLSEPLEKEVALAAAEVTAVATAAKQRARILEMQAEPHTEEEVTPAASEVTIEEDGWQKVPTKQAKRAAHKAAKEEREQRAVHARKEREEVRDAAATPAETASKESESCASESGCVARMAAADAETTEAPSSAAAVEPAPETAVCDNQALLKPVPRMVQVPLLEESREKMQRWLQDGDGCFVLLTWEDLVPEADNPRQASILKLSGNNSTSNKQYEVQAASFTPYASESEGREWIPCPVVSAAFPFEGTTCIAVRSLPFAIGQFRLFDPHEMRAGPATAPIVTVYERVEPGTWEVVSKDDPPRTDRMLESPTSEKPLAVLQGLGKDLDPVAPLLNPKAASPSESETSNTRQMAEDLPVAPPLSEPLEKAAFPSESMTRMTCQMAEDLQVAPPLLEPLEKETPLFEKKACKIKNARLKKGTQNEEEKARREKAAELSQAQALRLSRGEVFGATQEFELNSNALSLLPHGAKLARTPGFQAQWQLHCNNFFEESFQRENLPLKDSDDDWENPLSAGPYAAPLVDRFWMLPPA
eukprot:symbB.v1.2.034060.t1/scaffold4330.1/size48751/2